jgi:HPt (histidine-containing phosphotransfer) domain-containing protein
MKLSTRFATIVAVLVAAVAFTCLAGVRGLDLLHQSLEHVVSADMQRLLTITNVRRQFRSLVVAEREYILAPSAEEKAKAAISLAHVVEELRKQIPAYERLMPAADREAMVALEGALERWLTLDERVRAESQAGHEGAAYQLAAQHRLDPVSWEESIAALVAANELRLKTQVAETAQTWARMRSTQLAVTGAAALIGILAGVVVFRGIRRQMDEVVELNANLEGLVAVRTRALAERERSLQLILDSTGDGLVAVDRTGKMEEERARAIVGWFGAALPPSRLVWDYLFPSDANACAQFQCAFEQLAEDCLPFAVSADQMPHRLEQGQRILELAFKQVFEQEQFTKVLVTLRDVTVEVAAERQARAATETQALIGALLRDRHGFLNFVREAGGLIDIIEREESALPLLRALHTLKGNAFIFGLGSVGHLCHEIEGRVASESRGRPEDLQALRRSWKTSMSRVEEFLGSGAVEGLQISAEDLTTLRSQLLARRDHQDILAFIDQWTSEPIRNPLRRLGAHAERVASSAEKEVRIGIEDGGLRVPPDSFPHLWSALVHLIRNSIAHGLESRQERTAAAKPAVGILTFRARRASDGRLEIDVEDDGRGIDWTRVEAKARQQGLPAQTRSDLVEALFADGFTTASAANDLAGRGAGLSAVRAACLEAQGTLRVESEPGRGARFIVSLPFPATHAQGTSAPTTAAA